MLDTSPDSKCSEDCVESKTRGPNVSIRMEGDTMTCVKVISGNNGFGPYFCSFYHDITRQISTEAGNGPSFKRLFPIKIHSMTPTSAAKSDIMKTRSFLEQR